VVAFPPGGPIDAVARLVAPRLEEKWKQPVIVDNRAGAGGVIGTEYTARARPDGHTITLNGNAIVTYQLFVKGLGFDPARDLKPIAVLTDAPYVVAVPSALPVKSWSELIAYAKQRPGALNYGELPNTQQQLQLAVVFEKAGVRVTPIPYQGAAPLAAALLKNEIQIGFASRQAIAAQIEAGKLVPVATTGPRRYAAYPQLPTLRESGVDFDITFWFALFGPAGIPDAASAKIAADAMEAVRHPSVEPRVRALGFELPDTTPAQFRDEVAASIRSYTEIANRLGVKPQ
jgi:tripartite-type tricarboxylate transporter receptor subunit TctC